MTAVYFAAEGAFSRYPAVSRARRHALGGLSISGCRGFSTASRAPLINPIGEFDAAALVD